MSPQVTDCTLETGLQAPLVFSRTLALLEAWRDGKSSNTRLEAQTGGAGWVAQAFCSALLCGGGGIILRMREEEAVLKGPSGQVMAVSKVRYQGSGPNHETFPPSCRQACYLTLSGGEIL